MSKAFTKESDGEGDEPDHAAEEAAHADLAGSQELHHAERLAATQRRAAVSGHQGTAGGDTGGGLGGEQWRSQRKRRLSVRQAAAARDRSADSLSHETNRCRGGGGPGSPEKWAGGDAGLLRSDRALRECRWHGAGGERRRHRRSRSGSPPHQLEVATCARVDECPDRATASSFTRRAGRSNCRSSRCGTSASRWSLSREPPGAEAAAKPRRSGG